MTWYASATTGHPLTDYPFKIHWHSAPVPALRRRSPPHTIEHVNDLPPDLPRLRTLETWLLYTLDRVQRQIADAERREAERQRGEQARPAPPDWLLELGLNRSAPPVQLHVGDCWNSGKRRRDISRDDALRALADGVKACGACRPDSKLGYLDG